MSATPSSPPAEQVTLDRLESQIDWYSKRSKSSKRWFKGLKAITIVSAALIPVLTTLSDPNRRKLAAALGVLIAVLESLQQLNQFQSNWSSYRSTAEALQHEKFLFLAKAGSYLNAENASALLAERVESLVSQENTRWFSSQTPSAGGAPPRQTKT